MLCCLLFSRSRRLNSAHMVSCCSADKAQKLCRTLKATFHTCLTIGTIKGRSSPSSKEPPVVKYFFLVCDIAF